MMRGKGDVLKDAFSEKIIYEALKADIKAFAKQMKEKYKPKLKKIQEIKDSQMGLGLFEVDNLIWEYVKEDDDLRHAIYTAQQLPLVTKRMVKEIFKDCFNEVLNKNSNIIENGKPKTTRMLLVEMVVQGVLTGTITANQLRGLEIIRDTVGERPANEIISKGIQQKIVDVTITKEKVDKVKDILDSLRSANITDGLKQNIALRGIPERPGNEGVIETNVSGESERVHNPDVLPDKQD